MWPRRPHAGVEYRQAPHGASAALGRFQLPIAGEAGNIVLLGQAKPMRDCAVLASRAVPIAFAAPRVILKIRMFPTPFVVAIRYVRRALLLVFNVPECFGKTICLTIV